MKTKERERPLLMSGDMVRAVLSGAKTQTRRPCKQEPGLASFDDVAQGDHRIRQPDQWTPEEYRYWCDTFCPYKVGSLVWVREAFDFVIGKVVDKNSTQRFHRILYKADGNPPATKWTPSIHMPRWASRLTLEITDIRVQRSREISEEDAKAEGLVVQTGDGSGLGAGYKWDGPGYWDTVSMHNNRTNLRTYHVAEVDGVCCCHEGQRLGMQPARCAFRTLWDSVYGKGAWDANPWCWCLTFRRVEVSGK